MTTDTAAVHYELRVHGHLDRHWATWFGGLALTCEDDGTTTLRGTVTDQAELHGLLARIRDLGVTLLSLTSLDAARPGATATACSTRSSVSPDTADATATGRPELSLTRLHLMRAGYLLMGGGRVLGQWPLLPDAAGLPLYEGVTLCLLTAMSLLAFLGLRYPVTLLPVLLFEALWKLLWLALVALPRATGGGLDAATTQIVINCSLVVVILAVIPWPYVWRHYVLATGDRWRR